LAALLGTSCARPAAAPRAGAPAAVAPKARHVFLWRTASATATVYLLGSIHVARADLYPLPRVIEEAFAASDTLVLETELDGASLTGAALEIMKHATLPAGDSLATHVSPETHAKLRHYLEGKKLPPDAFDRLQPWFVAMALPALDAEESGYSAADGIDVYFHDKAQGKKRIASLESIDSQVALLLGLGAEDQEQLLLGALETESGDDLERLFEWWKAGDTEAFAASVLENGDTPENQELTRRFLLSRNENMTRTVEGYLATRGTYFVVVGSAHLVGERSIVDLLRRRGHRVAQL
jgi:uncharacterized protein YbaP (TraB family)